MSISSYYSAFHPTPEVSGAEGTTIALVTSDTISTINQNITTVSQSVADRAPIDSPTFTGVPKAPTASAGTNTTQIATTAFVTTAISSREPSISIGTTSQYWRGDKTWQTLNKAAVGLGNVDNTSDATKFSSPTLTGVPVAPTAAAGTNTTQVATTAFVTSSISGKADKANPTFTGTATMAKLVIGDGSILTIASDTIAVTTGYHRLDTESAAATDDLIKIDGGVDGQILTLRVANVNRIVRLKSNATGGNINLQNGDCYLYNQGVITLIYGAVGTAWRELSRPLRLTSPFVYTTNADQTFSVKNHPEQLIINAAYTAVRNIILADTGAVSGDKFRLSNIGTSTMTPIVRNLTSGGNQIFMLAMNRWIDVMFDGTNWVLVASGNINE